MSQIILQRLADVGGSRFYRNNVTGEHAIVSIADGIVSASPSTPRGVAIAVGIGSLDVEAVTGDMLPIVAARLVLR